MSNTRTRKIQVEFVPTSVESEPGELRFQFEVPADLAKHLKIKSKVALVLNTRPFVAGDEDGGSVEIYCTELNSAPPVAPGSEFNAARCAVFTPEDWPAVLGNSVIDPGRTAFAHLVTLLSTDMKKAAA